MRIIYGLNDFRLKFMSFKRRICMIKESIALFICMGLVVYMWVVIFM